MEHSEIKFAGIKTSKTELRDIAKAWIVISLAFALAFSSISLMEGNVSKIYSRSFLVMFGVSLFTAGLGFLLHEMAHKLVAQRYGCMAEFRAFDQMLYLALILAFLSGFIFAAPGAVMISGMITRKENGLISVAGPATNYVLAAMFLGLNFAFPGLSILFLTGFSINAWLGLFNMIPFGNFDGSKIWAWNISAWFGMVGVGVFYLWKL
ncbi:metalloprotease [Candidatus Woesearchaeota archaeon]|nr:metalloprotease [Candidatus Woesearchaeota archaeon]